MIKRRTKKIDPLKQLNYSVPRLKQKTIMFNKKTSILITIFSVILIDLSSCGSKSSSGGTPADPCTGVSIIVNGTASNSSGAGSSDGSISASASGGSGITYSINGGAFQASGNFTGLSAGSYTIIAKDSRGCSGSKPFVVNANDACAAVNFTTGGTAASSGPCSPFNGSITVTTSGTGSGFTYNINGGAFQSSPVFNNLEAKTYTIGAKEAGGCIRTSTITVNTIAAGTLFTAVKAILAANCALSGCHAGATPTGGIDFTQNCQIVANSIRIKERAVTNFGSPTLQMPPPPAAGLSAGDRTAITNWVNAGGQFNN